MEQWLLCPECRHKTRLRILEDTGLLLNWFWERFEKMRRNGLPIIRRMSWKKV